MKKKKKRCLKMKIVVKYKIKETHWFLSRFVASDSSCHYRIESSRFEIGLALVSVR